jgi:hypothetical protein
MRPWNPDVAPPQVCLNEERAIERKHEALFEEVKSNPEAFLGLFASYVQDEELAHVLVSAVKLNDTDGIVDWLVENRYKYE